MERAVADQCPNIDAGRIEMVRSPDFVRALRDTQTPVDGIQTFEAILLQEAIQYSLRHDYQMSSNFIRHSIWIADAQSWTTD